MSVCVCVIIIVDDTRQRDKQR